MKKTISMLLVIFTFSLLFTIPASAKDTQTFQTEYLDNDEYFVTVIEEQVPETTFSLFSVQKSKNGSKTTTYYKNNKAQWALKVQGTFSYNGSNSCATAASGTLSYSVAGLSPSSKGSYTSGNAAIAYVTVNSVSRSVTLYCDKNGKLS